MSWHRHCWTLIGTKVGKSTRTGGVFTIVLYRCSRCSKLREREITGRWSIDELRPR